MGFLGNKKNKQTEKIEKDQTGSARRSRRVVVPGQGKPQTGVGKAPAAPAAPAKPASAPVKPAVGGGTARVSRPGSGGQTAQRPPAKVDSGRTPAAAPVADTGFMLGGGSTSVESVPTSSPTPARPKTREPIVDSQPLAFTGDLAAADGGSGPVRTGDHALSEFLVKKASLISSDQSDRAQLKAKTEQKSFDQALVEMGHLSEDQLVSALTQECWVPHLRVDKYEIRKKALDTVAREDAIRYSVFPVDKLGSLLTLAMVNPLDAETIRVLESKTGLDIKKVVATRSEIAQGIEKYYSGNVQAKDGSISFTQDVEPKSVTQMLSKVQVKDEALPPMFASAPVAVPEAAPSGDIIPDIQDIDDLLASDEKIAPAIIEPIGIEPILADEPVSLDVGEFEPLAVNPGEIEAENEFVDIDIAAPSEPALAGLTPKAGSSLLDLDVDISLPEANQAAPPVPAAKAPDFLALAPAPEFLDDAASNAPEPMIKGPTRAFNKPAPAAKAPEPRVQAPAPKPAAAKPTPQKAAPARTAQIVNLAPVMEEEFQHAITHGKAHLFERWVGLQTRNRIINAQLVENELDTILAPIYESPRAIA